MADTTIGKQNKDFIETTKSVLSYNFDDLIFGLAQGLANSDKRLGSDYIDTMNRIIYTESSLAKVAGALKEVDLDSLPGVEMLGPTAGLGLKLFSAGLNALSKDLEVAYINVEVEKPVVDPNGMVTKTKLDLKMPRFLVYDHRPLSVKNAKMEFTLTLDTVYKRHIEGDVAGSPENLKLRGGIRSRVSQSSNSDSEPNSYEDNEAKNKAEIKVEVNFAQAEQQTVGYKILEEVFKDVAKPIER